MPVISIPLSGTEFSIFNSIYYKIIKDVAEAIEVDEKTMTVLYKNIEYAKTDNETTMSVQTKDNKPTTVSKRRFTVRVNQEYDEDNLGTTAVHQEEHYPIFLDRETSVSITPVYIQMDVELEFQYHSPSKSEVNTMRDMIRIHLSRMRNIGHHEVEYTLLIPEAVEGFIEDVHTLRNRLIPQELAEYFLENSSNRVHPITDMSNKENTRLGVQEKQVRIVGTYGFSPTPEKAENNTDNNTNTFSFTYAFSVTIPRALSVRYPPMICNRLLPARYLTFVEEARKKDYLERNRNINYIGRSNYNLSHFEAHRQLENRVNINLPINVPMFDEFPNKQGHKGYGIVMSFLLEVDETDRRTLFNLKDLDPYQLSSSTLEDLKAGDRHYVTKPYQSYMYLGLYQEGRHFDDQILEVTENLDVVSKIDLSLIKPVRVAISICIDTSMLSSLAIGRLSSDTELFLNFMKEHLEVKRDFSDFIRNQSHGNDNLVEIIVKFIQRNLDIDNPLPVIEVMKLVSFYDELVTSTLVSSIVNYRKEMMNALENLGMRFFKVNGCYGVKVVPEEPKVGRGDPVYPLVVDRSLGIIIHPEFT